MRLKDAIRYNETRADCVLPALSRRLGIPPLELRWGNDLIKEIMRWQRELNLEEDGLFGPETAYATADVPEDPKQRERSRAYNDRRLDGTMRDPITLLDLDTGSDAFVRWTALLQAALGLKVDGAFGPRTEEAFLTRYGTEEERQELEHPLPLWVSRWGYDHGHPWEDTSWPLKDEQFAQLTGTGSWAAGMLRLVSGWSATQETFSRGLDSIVTLDTVSVGHPHYWAQRIPKVIAHVWNRAPEVCALGWGEDGRERFGLASFARELDLARTSSALSRPSFTTRKAYRVARGHKPASASLNWFASGWWRVSRHPDFVRAFIKHWIEDYLEDAWHLLGRFGWHNRARVSEDGGRILAAATRMSNSGMGAAIRRLELVMREVGRDPMKAFRKTFLKPRSQGGYGHPDRWHKIMSWEEFAGPAPRDVAESLDAALDFSAAPLRSTGDSISFKELK